MNIATNISATSNTIDDVLTWLDRMGERGIYNPASARFKRNAIEQFMSVLGPEEPRTALYMHEQIDHICDRWAKKENPNPDTARTYKSRASTAVSDYLRYQENPQGFRAKSSPKKSTKKSTAKKPTKLASESTPGPQQPEPQATQQATYQAQSSPRPDSSPLLRNFPMGRDREPFVYALPDGMVVTDVIKIACHLLTLAEDFDPTNAKTSAIFAMARRDG